MIEVKLEKVRLSFPKVIDPDTAFGETKYKADLVLDTTTPEGQENLKKVEAAIAQVTAGATPKGTFLKDGKPEQVGPDMKVVTGKNKEAPMLCQSVDGATKILDRNEIRGGELFTAGNIVDAVISVHYYPKNGWVSARLHGLRYVDKGVPFGGVVLDAHAFDELG